MYVSLGSVNAAGIVVVVLYLCCVKTQTRATQTHMIPVGRACYADVHDTSKTTKLRRCI